MASKTITIYVFHKPGKGFYTYGSERDGIKVGDPIRDLTKVFTTKGEADEFASGYGEELVDGNWSTYHKYIRPAYITIEV
jgi:hypothetical protein